MPKCGDTEMLKWGDVERGEGDLFVREASKP
jgi:hypothetical protein